jgi:hypothetical protein
MTKKNRWLVMLVVALVFGMMACEEAKEDDPDLDLTDYTVYFGTYKSQTYTIDPTSYTNITETVVLDENRFFICDNSFDGGSSGVGSGTLNYIDFEIAADGWEKDTTPPDYADDYPYAFKFTGKIKNHFNYIPSGATAPGGTGGFSATDITNETECWMSIYFNINDNDEFIFVRTAFSKEGANNEGRVVDFRTDQTYRAIRRYTFDSGSTTPPSVTQTKP